MVFFLTAEIPTVTPSVIDIGLNAVWKRYWKDYLYADSWVVTYYFVSADQQFTCVGTDNGDSYHLFTNLAAATAVLKAGDYSYQAVAVNGTSKVKLEQGVVELKDSFIAATGGLDTVSKYKKILDTIDASIQEIVLKTTSEVTVNGTTYKRADLDKLLVVRDRYLNLYNQELRNIRLNNGQSDPRKTYIGFSAR